MRQASNVFFSDVDNTLIDPEIGFTDVLRETLQLIEEKSDYFIPCSGRPVDSLLRQFGRYVPYVIGFNGAEIRNSENEVFYTNGFSEDEVDIITKVLERSGMDYVLYGEKYYTNNPENKYAQYEGKITEEGIQQLVGKMASPKVLGLSDPENVDAAVKELRKQLPDYEINKSTQFFIEITKSGVSKGNAILIMRNLLKLQDARIFAMGDGNNDISMFTLNDVEVVRLAVENATDDLKENADMVIDSCKNNGVSKFITGYYEEINE